ncbi:hypothetical protein VF_A0575 [Aliivibrio fischeri ES114]|uniref:Uncharacterized protein n=1 Tax=Aliivibrio fischeri (strain ATCC 700601 / ES114) TaxID=312309 RepID=Q5E001_ALIF1|nr:hypothetical protein VF_A0574 [Aliivibrio fischeri ES114]AAW87645.1 hypothetical protein VF_A0575 [Aliivibrio fischeri ES114]
MIDKYVLEAQRGGERIFSRLRAALKIGFKRVEVCL